MNIEVAITKSYLKALANVPKGIQKKANEFFEKFKANPDAQSINYEKIINMKDDKVRTVRIDQKYRAIVLHPPEGNVYLFVYIDNHDEAMNWAKNKIFDINEYTAAIQVVDLEIVNNYKMQEDNRHDWTNIEEKSIADMYSEEELIELGIPKIIFPVLKFVKNNQDLIDYIQKYVSSDIFDILEFCLEGIPADEIKECFSVEPIDSNLSMLEAMQKDINKSYVHVISEEETISDILDNPIDYWRIFIHPKQMNYVVGNDGNYNGSFQIKGSAGTGKTVVAMHRAKYLASKIYTKNTDKILFTTYSKKLTKSVEYNLKNMCNLETLKRIEVVNLHSWIAKYLKEHNISFEIIDDQLRYKYINSAIKKLNLEDSFSATDIITEIDVVLSYNQITDLSSYLRVSRNGTYKKLGRNQRMQVWEIISEYFEMLNDSQKTEWWLLIKNVIYMIENKKDVEYSAIIVDEAQDFGMPEYRLLRSLVREKENDLFIVGDIRQKIYSNKANFSKCGVNIKGNRTRYLNINYRNTLEIGMLADKVIEGIEFDELDEFDFEDKKTNYVIKGLNPIIKSFKNRNSEAEFVIEEIKKIVSSGISFNEIAIVARTNSYLKMMTSLLKNAGISVLSLEDINSIDRNSVYVGTMHSIKGFEFKVVLLIGINDDMLPYKKHIESLKNDKEIDAFMQQEKSLLYVAITRARDLIYILSSNNRSELV